MLQITDKDKLDNVLRIIKDLKIKFVVATLAREMPASKSSVSDYISGKKGMSDKFYKTFIERFAPNEKPHKSEISQNTKQVTVKDLPKSEFLESLIRSNESLSLANKELAENAVRLTKLLEINLNAVSGNDIAVETMRHNLLELLSKLGIRDAKHPSKPISILELNRLYADIENRD